MPIYMQAETPHHIPRVSINPTGSGHKTYQYHQMVLMFSQGLKMHLFQGQVALSVAGPGVMMQECC